MKKYFLVLLILSFSFVCAQDFTKTNATDCISSSENLMNELSEANFTILRVNDTLQRAMEVYDSQLYYELQGRKGNYDSVSEYCNQILILSDSAFYSRDSLNVLLSFYNMTYIDGMNNTKIEAIISEVNSEIKNERYEKVPALIDTGYNEISQMQADYSLMNRFYFSTIQSIKNFLITNWRILGVAFFLILIFLIFLRISLKKFLLMRRIRYLEERKQSLKDYLRKTQFEYFQKGRISEADYRLRSKKFAEMIRDIDRDLPMLQEKLVKAGVDETEGGVYGKRNVAITKKNIS